MSDSNTGHPQRGVDYPQDLLEFDEFFPDEAACWRYLERLRWPDGFECPKCGTQGEPWRTSGGRLLCPGCKHKLLVTAGTLFHKTRKPLRLWFRAAWEITSQKYGANALGLQRVLGLGSYETAWAWLHKFRRAMVRPGRDRLSGTIEVDESYVGGPEAGLSGRKTVKKAIVAIAVELTEEETIARIRLRHVPDVSADSLIPFLEEVVEPGSTIRTDGWKSYGSLPSRGYQHDVTVLSHTDQPAHIVFPSVSRVAALLKRWILGTLQGGIASEHLNSYLDEFTFRFNRRASKARGLLFYRLLQYAVQVPPVTTEQLAQDTGRGPR